MTLTFEWFLLNESPSWDHLGSLLTDGGFTVRERAQGWVSPPLWDQWSENVGSGAQAGLVQATAP